MWIHLQPDLGPLFLPLATAAAVFAYAVIGLGGLFAAAIAHRPRRALRVAAWSGGLAAFCAALTASIVLLDPPWADDDIVRLLLGAWLLLFLAGLALIAWQGGSAAR